MRLQVNVSDEMVERIDHYANKMGVSRSALCSVAIGQYVFSLDKSLDVMDSVGSFVGRGLLDTLKSESNEK